MHALTQDESAATMVDEAAPLSSNSAASQQFSEQAFRAAIVERLSEPRMKSSAVSTSGPGGASSASVCRAPTIDETAVGAADSSEFGPETSAKFETSRGTSGHALPVPDVAASDSRTLGDAGSGDASGDSQEQSRGDDVAPVGDSVLGGALSAAEIAEPALERAAVAEGGSSPTVAEQVFGEISGRVELSHRDGKIDFRMRLDPPGLGTVHVRLTAAEGTITAQLIVDDPAARQAIESQWQSLHESLAGLGVSLERFATASDGGDSRGPWQWQQPEQVGQVRPAFPKPAARSPAAVSRSTTGAIDLVV